MVKEKGDKGPEREGFRDQIRFMRSEQKGERVCMDGAARC
jgi:hypothetical protein